MLLFHTIRNRLDYPLRQLMRWRRPGLHLRNEPKDNLFSDLAPDERLSAEVGARHLLVTYRLHTLYAASTRRNYRENLFYLEMLERALSEVAVELPPGVCAADVGCSHWFYVKALHALLTWRGAGQPRTVHLDGFEVDAFRVYADLRSRYDHAQFHLDSLPGVRYMTTAFTAQPGRYDLVTLLFPFVFRRDALEWGLPHYLFRPLELLADAWRSVRPGGTLIVVNQGEAEHREQQALLAETGLKPTVAFRHDSLFFQYKIPRFVLVAKR